MNEHGIDTSLIKKKYEQRRERRHFGLLAQELQAIYPNLVKEGQGGYLYINYIELVPILIRSIQELKAEIDELKDVSEGNELSRTTAEISINRSSTAKLYQNAPNPFSVQTTIRFSLPDNTRDAYICIFDMTGKMLKKCPISSEMDSIAINGNELGEGIYLYSLLVNGQEIETKRMILTN